MKLRRAIADRSTRVTAGLATVIVVALLAGCGARSLRHSEAGQSFSGVASWYGQPFHGRRTASGEIFDMHAHTAAHRSLPFGTRLRVTSVESGRSTVVTVNDRGPFIRGRHLDLSYAAADDIGLVGSGVGRVRADVLGRDLRYLRSLPKDPPRSTSPDAGVYAIQFGAFHERENAFRLKQALDLTSRGVRVTQGIVDGETYYRVRLGTFSSGSEARDRARTFADDGYSVIIVEIAP